MELYSYQPYLLKRSFVFRHPNGSGPKGATGFLDHAMIFNQPAPPPLFSPFQPLAIFFKNCLHGVKMNR